MIILNLADKTNYPIIIQPNIQDGSFKHRKNIYAIYQTKTKNKYWITLPEKSPRQPF